MFKNPFTLKYFLHQCLWVASPEDDPLDPILKAKGEVCLWYEGWVGFGRSWESGTGPDEGRLRIRGPRPSGTLRATG